MKRFLLFAVLSVAIFEARGAALGFALAAALIATLATLRLPVRPPLRLRPIGCLAFAAFFLRESVRGGIDVSLRAFRGRSALQPGFVDYPLRIRHPSARVLLANSISLMPGTFTAGIATDHLRVHVLDTREAMLPRLRAVEDRLIRAFVETPA